MEVHGGRSSRPAAFKLRPQGLRAPREEYNFTTRDAKAGARASLHAARGSDINRAAAHTFNQVRQRTAAVRAERTETASKQARASESELDDMMGQFFNDVKEENAKAKQEAAEEGAARREAEGEGGWRPGPSNGGCGGRGSCGGCGAGSASGGRRRSSAAQDAQDAHDSAQAERDAKIRQYADAARQRQHAHDDYLEQVAEYKQRWQRFADNPPDCIRGLADVPWPPRSDALRSAMTQDAEMKMYLGLQVRAN